MATAKGLSFYCNGQNLGATAITGFTSAAEAEELEDTVIGKTSRTYLTAFQNGTLSAEGIWSYDQVNADEIHNILSSAMTGRTECDIAASLAAWSAGADCILMSAIETGFSVEAPTGQLVMVSADFRATSGINFGKCLFGAEVNTTTTAGTSVNNGASTANGGLFQVHYQDGSGTEDLTAKIQHSSNNSTWADLGTISVTNVANFGSSSLVIAAGTTVQQYIRASIQVAQGALTVQAAFARR